MSMIPCSACGRHHRVADDACPFCGSGSAAARSPRLPLARKAFHLVGGAVTTVVLAACYGVGGFEEDQDGDGFYDYEDCDDYDAAINPGATEICDDTIDNDCDDAIDDADTDCGGSTDATDDTDT